MFSGAERGSAACMRWQDGRSTADLLVSRFIAAHKARHPPSVLPFGEHRNSQGKLWAAEAVDVPEYLNAAPLKGTDWPMDLGRLDIPLQVDTSEDVRKAAAKGMGELMWFPCKSDPRHGGWSSKLRAEFRSKRHRSSKEHLLGHFGGISPHWSGYGEPYSDLACALFVLLVYEIIELEHEIVAGPPPGPSALDPAAASSRTSQQNPAPKGAMVRLTIRLKHQKRSKFADNTSGLLTGRPELCLLIHYLLREGIGSGLTVGPDCDGYLNLGMHGMEDAANSVEDADNSSQDAGPSTSEAVAWQPVPRGDTWACGRQPDPSLGKLELEQMLKGGALKSNAPRAYCPGAVRSKPKQFQLQALDWMLKREETGDARGKGHLSLHPGYLQFITPAGHALHMQREHSFRFTFNLPTCPTSETCGGLLCDHMGLGKTLEVLMLVLARPAGPWAIAQLPKQQPGKQTSQKRKKDKWSEATESSDDTVPIKTTLVIVPAGLRQQWADEIKHHLQRRDITWDFLPALVSAAAEKARPFQGRDERTRRSQRHMTTTQKDEQSEDQDMVPIICENGTPLHTCDIVLASYEHVKQELETAGKKSPLLQYGFWRLVLDEAQQVASTNKAAAVSVSSLWRRHAWVVTGTPMSENARDLGGLLEFLAYKPFYQTREWDAILTMPEWVGAIKQLLHEVMLRRSHADVAGEVALPRCTREDRVLRFSFTEQHCYDQTLRLAGEAIANCYPRWRQPISPMRYFTMLRQICCHPQVVRQNDMLMGDSEHLSMTDLLGRLTLRSFREYDSVAQRLVKARMMLAAVLWKSGAREEGLQEYAAVSQDLQHGKERAACVELVALMNRTGSQGELLSEPKSSAVDITWTPDTSAQEVPGPSARPSEEAAPAKPGTQKGRRAGSKRKATEEEKAAKAEADEKAREAASKQYDNIVRSQRDPVGKATAALQAARDEVARVFKDLQHLYVKYQELRAASKGKQPMGTGGQLPVVEQEDPDTCPICLETSERKAITTCGHLFCRTKLTVADIFDAATDEEAVKAQDQPRVEGKYGTKVDALVKDILEKDPSSPKVLLILMSTGGGAAGLTLTAASRVYLMEPSSNPGLEAQAVGRVHRMGQTRETRVIRLLIEGTVEELVLARQQASHCPENSSLLAADTDYNSVVSMLSNHPGTPPAMAPTMAAH
ncbi:hypothetical protein WJX73_004310 [Symbiochloris irregularis]|uniref:Helicase C-terminal domain-containing protein n=1 Tax=Symbiochloris irregularis TaxID=706552 RepID=A0AAW1P706_9CHLO